MSGTQAAGAAPGRTALVLRNVSPMGGERVDLHVVDGRIEHHPPGTPVPDGADIVEAASHIALPGLVDAHAHIDKTLWGEPWHSHRAGPSVPDRIDNEIAVRAELALDPARQAARLARHMIARGTAHVRTHVDIGADTGLDGVHGVMRMREEHARWLGVQIVAFPQTGVMRVPGVLDLLDNAVRDGAEVVGGIDPVSLDRDPKGQLDGIFDIAARHGAGVDIHLHDAGEMGAVTVDMIAERTGALGLAGKVVISHAFCLGSVAPARLGGLIEQLVRHDIAIMSHGPGGGTVGPPVRKLHEAGVRVFSGSDGVRDAWGPLNTGDMLERAFIVAYVNGWRDDAGLELALHMATGAGAQVLGVADYGVGPGCVADLVLVEAPTLGEAVVAHPVRRLVVKGGAVVARDGQCGLEPVG